MEKSDVASLILTLPVNKRLSWVWRLFFVAPHWQWAHLLFSAAVYMVGDVAKSYIVVQFGFRG